MGLLFGSGQASSDPAYFTAMSDKVWTLVSSNVADDVRPAGVDANTFKYTMQSWNGAVMCPLRYSMVLPGLGGHTVDYNPILEFLFNQTSPAWVSRFAGSAANNTPVNADGTGASIHSYDMLACDASGIIWRAATPNYPDVGNNSHIVFSIDPSDWSWTQHSVNATNGTPEGCCAYDTATDHIYHMDSSSGSIQVGKIDCSDGSSTALTISNPINGQACATIDADARVMFVSSENEGLRVMDISDDTPTITSDGDLDAGSVIGDSSETGGDNHYWHGLVYDETANSGVGALYLYGGNQTVVKVTMPSNRLATTGWSIANVSGITGADPGSRQGNGTYGRFDMMTMPSGDRLLFVVNATNAGVYAMRVPSGGL